MMYRTNDLDFRKKVEELDPNTLLECHYEEDNGRRTPGMIWNDLRSQGTFVFLSNDSRFNGGEPLRNGFNFSWRISFGETKKFDAYFENLLKIQENTKFLVVDKTGKAGSFESKEAVGEYIVKNPKVEFRVFEIANELKPELSVKFG